MTLHGSTLSALVKHSQCLQQIRKGELRVGDRLLVVTWNSVYSLRVVEGGLYVVSGGWFDRNSASPMKVTIRGCTWGGSAIKLDVVAACGLRLEFGNRVITSPIRKVFVFPYGSEN
ncbi:MAG: hypothetical protein WBW16_11930 [Bacteroidota bacterium]